MNKWIKNLIVWLRPNHRCKDSAFVDPVTQAAKTRNRIRVLRPTTESEKPVAEDEPQKRVKAALPIEGRICPVCGGNLAVEVLTYWRDPTTDVFSPADISETCFRCRRVVTTELPETRGY